MSERLKVGLLFSTGGDTRPVSAKPSDSTPIPTVASYFNGIVGWPASPTTDALRQNGAAPVWARAGNRAGKWVSWVKLNG